MIKLNKMIDKRPYYKYIVMIMGNGFNMLGSYDLTPIKLKNAVKHKKIIIAELQGMTCEIYAGHIQSIKADGVWDKDGNRIDEAK